MSRHRDPLGALSDPFTKPLDITQPSTGQVSPDCSVPLLQGPQASARQRGREHISVRFLTLV